VGRREDGFNSGEWKVVIMRKNGGFDHLTLNGHALQLFRPLPKRFNGTLTVQYSTAQYRTVLCFGAKGPVVLFFQRNLSLLGYERGTCYNNVGGSKPRMTNRPSQTKLCMYLKTTYYTYFSAVYVAFSLSIYTHADK